MTAAHPAPLILTAVLDPASQARFDRERRQHFPSSLNIVPAHVTLFHHLPGEQEAPIRQALAASCAAQPAAPFAIAGLRFLGRGVAYALHMPEVAALRHRLAAEWRAWLTPQDSQPWSPHVTIQNKAPPADAKRLHAALTAGLVPQDGTVTGLHLWEYLGGPWQSLDEQAFKGEAPAAP